MTPGNAKILVVGAGVFGMTAALELGLRGHQVTVLDAGPIPNPLASSTDASRMVRMDYGPDRFYMDLADEAIDGWHGWNEKWGRTLYHETGLLALVNQPMEPGTFEHDCFELLAERGHNPVRLSATLLADRYPAWNSGKYVDGYYNPRAGWAEAEAVIAQLAGEAVRVGVTLRTGAKVTGMVSQGSNVVGVVTEDGVEQKADYVLVAAGTWTSVLLPHLQEVMWPVAQPLFYFKPADPSRFKDPAFLPWIADVSSTGWYGFPLNAEGIVKVANHGPGVPLHPDEPRDVPDSQEPRVREFLADSLPELGRSELFHSRLCLYCDTWDGNFWIDHDPERPGLVVAAGGSGHGFKFAPVLGGIIADVVEGIPNPYSHRFAWRPRGEVQWEAIRFTGE